MTYDQWKCGMATGVPLSPTKGFSTGAMLGAALHTNPARAHDTPVIPAPVYTPPETRI